MAEAFRDRAEASHAAELRARVLAGAAIAGRPTKVDDTVIKHTRLALDRGAAAKAEWQRSFDAWAAANPENKALFDRLQARELPAGWTEALPSWPVDPKGVSTRAASGAVLNALAPVLPELWGGSADLAESNNTTMKGADSFGPVSISTGAAGAGHAHSARRPARKIRHCPATHPGVRTQPARR